MKSFWHQMDQKGVNVSDRSKTLSRVVDVGFDSICSDFGQALSEKPLELFLSPGN